MLKFELAVRAAIKSALMNLSVGASAGRTIRAKIVFRYDVWACKDDFFQMTCAAGLDVTAILEDLSFASPMVWLILRPEALSSPAKKFSTKKFSVLADSSGCSFKAWGNHCAQEIRAPAPWRWAFLATV